MYRVFFVFNLVTEKHLERDILEFLVIKDGFLKPGRFVIPTGLIDLFREKANASSEAMAQISDQQRAKIDKRIQENLDVFAASDQFASIIADAEMFGVDAVISKPKKRKL